MNQVKVLKTPDFTESNIIGYNVGIRPYRKYGIRLEPEEIADKLIIHNYGYGGSGLTLSWGAATYVLSLVQQQKIAKPAANSIAVLGAGVMGLTTALLLSYAGFKVHIYADKFSPHVTSNVAAGILSPPATFIDQSDAHKALVAKLLQTSLTVFRDHHIYDDAFAGVNKLISYRIGNRHHGNPMDERFSFKGIFEEEDVTIQFDNGMSKSGKKIDELGLDGSTFMNSIVELVKSKQNISLSQKHFANIQDVLYLPETIIINCTSMGAEKIFNDQQFIPVRGHLIYLKPQVGIDYSFHQNIPHEDEYWVMLYPWHDRLILGGVFQEGNNDNRLDPIVIKKILQHARDCFNVGGNR